MNRLKKLEFNRLIKELDFIKSDYDYKSDLINDVDQEFSESVNSFLEKHPKLNQVYTEKETLKEKDMDYQEIDHVDTLEDESVYEESIVNVKIQKLYRAIAKSTHPDISKNENFNEIYIEATNAYDSNDILPIFSICEKLNIPYEISDEEEKLLKSEIEKTKNRLKFLETTFAWIWYTQEDISIKDRVILSYIESRLSK